MTSASKPKRAKRKTAPPDFGELFATHLRASVLLDEAVALAEASRVAGKLELALDQIQQAEALHSWLQQLEQRMRDAKSPWPESRSEAPQVSSSSH